MTFVQLFGREPDDVKYLVGNHRCRLLVALYEKPPKIEHPCCTPHWDHGMFRIEVCDHHRAELLK